MDLCVQDECICQHEDVHRCNASNIEVRRITPTLRVLKSLMHVTAYILSTQGTCIQCSVKCKGHAPLSRHSKRGLSLGSRFDNVQHVYHLP
jgi:hypothetical protein